MAIEAGQELLHYRLIEKIGEGGMGVVWKAHDTTLDRDVAIKILPEKLAADASRLARFEREAKAVAALNHPNIITVYSVEKDDGGPHFFTMELVNGTPLSRQIPKDGLPLGRFLDLAIPLADAISAAHEQGITHRDLKPANVMVTTENRVKVLDFGLAKLLREASVEGPEAPTRSMSLTHDGQLMGTIPYMSPEQVEGRAVDHRSDLFSLGVILYEMATGHHPFLGESHAAVMSAILRDSPASVTQRKPQLPADLGRIVRHCLQKDPERRYQTAKGLRNELAELRTTGETEARSDSGQLVPIPGTKRQARWVVPAAVVAGIAVAVAAFFWLKPNTITGSGEKRIVVLPFENLGSPDESYFADGMTEEITSRLAVVSGLGVISRTSAVRYANTAKTLQEIGEELGVGYVLAGSVRWDHKAEEQGRVRITPQLIRVKDDTLLWADAYGGRLEDVFALQSEIAGQVVRALGVALLASEQKTIEARPTDNLEAYNAYLRGISLSYPIYSKDLDIARQMFEHAVELDPTFGVAYAELARVLAWYQHTDSPAANPARAKEAIREALRWAPDSPEVQGNAGRYYYWGVRDYPLAIEHFRRAVELRPSYSYAYNGLGGALRGHGEFDAGLTAHLKALELDPKFDASYDDVGDSLSIVRRYAEADEYYRQAMELAPDREVYYFQRTENYLLWYGNTERAEVLLETWPGGPPVSVRARLAALNRGWQAALEQLSPLSEDSVLDQRVGCYYLLESSQPEAAQVACENARRLLVKQLEDRPGTAGLHAALGLTYARLGRKADAIREGRRAVELRPLSDHALANTRFLLDLARIYATAGEQDDAIEELDHLLSIPSWISVPMLRMDPIWDPLRDNPKFLELLDKYEPRVRDAAVCQLDAIPVLASIRKTHPRLLGHQPSQSPEFSLSYATHSTQHHGNLDAGETMDKRNGRRSKKA